MRALLAGSVCLLAAATAAAQPPVAPATAATPVPSAIPANANGTATTAVPAAPSAPPSTISAPGVPLSTALGDTATPDSSATLGEMTAGNPWRMTNTGWWAQADYLLWWVSSMNTPSLIQAVPTAAAQASVANNTPLAAGTAQRYFPPADRVKFGEFSGVRLNFGYNFDSFGLEASGFYLGQRTRSDSLFNDGTPASAAESYIRAGTGTPVSLFGSLAGQYAGGVASSVSSREWGADTSVRIPWFAFLTNSTDALAGFRYLELQEQVSLLNRPAFPNGTTLVISDSFKTRNDFYGAQIGLDGRIGPSAHGFGLDILGKMALGGVSERAELAGSNTYFTPGAAPDAQSGGLYARGANQGVFTRDIFAAVFELNTTLTYNFTSWAQVYAGYSIIWLSSAQRPGDLIDTTINDSQIRFVANPPANSVTAPIFHWHGTDFTTQGITIGLRLQY